MSLVSEKISEFISGKKWKSRQRPVKKRSLTVEPLEERQMLSVTPGGHEAYCGDPECALDFDALPPDDFAPVFFEEEGDSTITDEVYGELTFEQYYRLHSNVALREYLSQNGDSGPLAFEEFCIASNQVHLLQSPGYSPNGVTPGSPQSTSTGGSQYFNTYVVDTLLDVVNANDGVLSLREAVALANGSGGKDLITFADGLSGTITLNGSQLTLTDSVDIIGSGRITISGNNQARTFFVGTANTTVTLEGLTLTGCYTSGSGGAVHFAYASGMLRDTVIRDSSASNGGAICATYCDLALENCVIANNTALPTSGYGGAIYAAYCDNFVITDSVIEGNNGQWGGAVTLGTNVQNTITNTIIRDNTAYRGGGIYATRSSSESELAMINDVTITGSQITGNVASDHSGGALFLYSKNVTIADSVVSGNTAIGSAIGGIYFNSTGSATVTGSRIENNSSGAYGGGIAALRVTSGTFATQENRINIINSTVSGNSAATYGGGVYVGISSSLTVTSSLIANNTAQNKGGGIYATSSSAVVILNSTISGNKAETLTGFISTNEGGGIHSTQGTLDIRNSTITQNASWYGGGITSSRTTATVTIHNTIIAGNSASATTRGDDVYGTLQTTSSNNLIGSDNNLVGIADGTNGNKIGTTATPPDAKLAPLQNNGGPTWAHALLEGSPAIDAGNNALALDVNGTPLLYEQRGLARVFGTSVDIGACEYSSIMSVRVDDANQTPVLSGVSEVAFATEEYGTPQYLGFWITNEGENDLEIDFINATLPDGVWFYELPSGCIDSGETVYFEIVWAVIGGYLYGSWTQYNSGSPNYTSYFIYEKPLDIPAVVDTLELVSGTNASTTDPAVKGRISNDGALSGLTVEIYQGQTQLGSTTTNESGEFYYRPGSIATGSVTLSAQVKEWNVITRQYQCGVKTDITFTLVAQTTPAAAVTSLILGDVTGSGSSTPHPYLIGQLADDGENLNRVLIEFDHNGDSQTDGYTFSESDGTFRYTPNLAIDNYTIRARGVRWNLTTSSWVVGDWTNLSLTVTAKAANWVPAVSQISTAFGEANAQGVMVTTDPAVKGQLTSQGGFENLVMQYDLGGNGTVDYENTPDAWGRFAWRPEIDLGTSQSQNVTMKVRAGKIVNGTTTWGPGPPTITFTRNRSRRPHHWLRAIGASAIRTTRNRTPK